MPSINPHFEVWNLPLLLNLRRNQAEMVRSLAQAWGKETKRIALLPRPCLWIYNRPDLLIELFCYDGDEIAKSAVGNDYRAVGAIAVAVVTRNFWPLNRTAISVVPFRGRLKPKYFGKTALTKMLGTEDP